MSNTNKDVVQRLLGAMQSMIEKYGLEVLQRYPNDLLVHDRAILEQTAWPGAKIAWMVGHCHTHIVPLGLHPEENLVVTYLTNMSSEDRFFVFNIHRNDSFKMEELDRDGFAALSRSEVSYKNAGEITNFWLMRHKNKVGHISLKAVGTLNEPKVEVVITPASGTAELSRAALLTWASHSVRKWTQSLFTRTAFTWAEPLTLNPQQEAA